MRDDERVGKALEHLNALDLAALLDIGKQLVEVALKTTLRREHRCETRGRATRRAMKARENAPHLSYVTAP